MRLKRSPLRHKFLVASTALAGSLALAQSAATAGLPAQPAFEAVSIHLVDPRSAEGADGGMSSFPTNLFFLRRAPLAFLVQLAYRVDSQDHLAAMPGWMESQEISISAKVEGDQRLTLDQMQPLLQRLLRERFHFAAHSETRMVSGFALVVAKTGSRLRVSDTDSQPWEVVQPKRVAGGHMRAAQIAGALAHHLGQPVVDRTGLTGTYDYSVAFAPTRDTEPDLPDFFEALQEQLGLRLQPGKVPVLFLVIDHVDKVPTEN